MTPEQRRQLQIDELTKFMKSKYLMMHDKKYHKAVVRAIKKIKSEK